MREDELFQRSSNINSIFENRLTLGIDTEIQGSGPYPQETVNLVGEMDRLPTQT